MATLLIALRDDPGALAAVRTTLVQEGHIVVTTANGAEAMHLLSVYPFDGAVLDTSLAPVGGVQMLAHIRDRGPHCGMPVALVAADQDEQLALMAQQAADSAFLFAKPVDLTDVATAVLDLVSARARRSPAPVCRA